MVVMVAARRTGAIRRIAPSLMVVLRLDTAVLVDVMPKMRGASGGVPQRIANAHRRRIGGIQREQEGEQEGEADTHGTKYITGTPTRIEHPGFSWGY